MALFALELGGCVAADRFTLGEQCELSSECQDPLVCGFGRCRNACATGRDCGPGLRCVLAPEGYGVCSFPEENRCALDSDCPSGLVCRLAACTNACDDHRDCPIGARCAVDESGARYCEHPAPEACLRNSDCLEPLVCDEGGRCAFECFIASDCAAGEVCVGNTCATEDAGTPDAGPARCVTDAECSDDVFCNGAERCRPAAPGADARGCVAPEGAPCLSDTTCDEGLEACTSPCDADGDGVRAMGECGGDDCDDADGTIAPGLPDDCNYRDDDCDAHVDEDWNPDLDPRHCGFCGNSCAAFNALTSCVAGACRVDDCHEGFVDVDGRSETGCEARCTSGDDPCNGADDDCDGSVDEEPSASASCAGPQASASCTAGRCVLTCDAGYGDCNADPTDGCESDLSARETCGACGTRCSAGLACEGGSCEVSAIVDVHAGGSVSCIRRANGRVACWGDNSRGALGTGTRTPSRVPAAIPGLGGVTAMAAAGITSSYTFMSHVCAVDGSGAISCWGENVENQAGPSAAPLLLVPTALPSPMGASALAAGDAHSCALVAGAVQCWGSNQYGQLGDGTVVDSPVPVTAASLSSVVSIGAGFATSCAALSDGSAMCWGYNGEGGVGDGTLTHRSTPTAVIGISDAVEAAAGANHSCLRRVSGAVSCFGRNAFGQLGLGYTSGSEAVPVAVPGLSDAEGIALGAIHSCARRATGEVTCWGANWDGQLGDGAGGRGVSSSAPVAVIGLDGVVALAAGAAHTCALRSDGSVYCWGDNGTGQLGSGSYLSDYETSPVPVEGL